MGGFSADAVVGKSDIGVHELLSELQVAPWVRRRSRQRFMIKGLTTSCVV